jgi:hypothetical protein
MTPGEAVSFVADGGGSKTTRTGVPRLALSLDEAAASLGVSRDFFDGHVRPELRIIQRGRRPLVAVRELQRWLDRAGSLPLAEDP